jgi:hypothetical protein
MENRTPLFHLPFVSYINPDYRRDFAADTHLLKLQRLQNKVLRSIGNF